MKDHIEDILSSKKMEIEKLKAPEDFESRIGNALRNRKKKRFNRRAIAVVLIAALLLTYNFDTIAYYGKKLLGYDEVTSESIRQLNEEGMGQEINKSCTFSDGTKVILDGIMFDDKELVAFYKIENKNKEIGAENVLLSLKGLAPIRYSARNGHGKAIDSNTQVWTMTFEPPVFFEKWMSFDIEHSINGKFENGSIDFTLNRSKAMKHTVKYNINKEIKIGDVNVDFKTITASRLSTVVEGKLEAANTSSTQSLKDREKEFSGLAVDFDLIANSKKLQPVSGTRSAVGENINITSTSDGLPTDVNSLEIKNIHLVDTRMIDKDVALTAQTKELKLADDLVIKNVYYEGENTCVTVESKGIPNIGLFIDGRQADSIGPVPSADNESYAGYIGKVFKFKGRGDNMKLSVKTLCYAQFCDQTINIPVD